MGSGGVAIAALPTVICLKVPFSDGLGGGKKLTTPKACAQKVITKNNSFIAFFQYWGINCYKVM